MSGWQMVPRAVRRKAIAVALSDPRNVPSVRRQLQALKVEREKAAKVLALMDEAIEDTEALLGEVRA